MFAVSGAFGQIKCNTVERTIPSRLSALVAVKQGKQQIRGVKEPCLRCMEVAALVIRKHANFAVIELQQQSGKVAHEWNII